MSDSGNIDAALVSKLSADAALTAAMPDGVYVDVAPSGKTKFVIVSLVSETDTPTFGERAFEDALYLVKAVALGTSGSSVKTAAARIDALLDQQPLTVTGFDSVVTRRDERIRYTEADDVNPDTRWQHSGGRYSVFASAA